MRRLEAERYGSALAYRGKSLPADWSPGDLRQLSMAASIVLDHATGNLSVLSSDLVISYVVAGEVVRR